MFDNISQDFASVILRLRIAGLKLFIFSLTFFFLLAPRVKLNIGIHTGFLSIAIIIALAIFERRDVLALPEKMVSFITFMLFLSCYHFLFATLYDNDGSYFSMICISTPISLLFGWLLASYWVNHGADTNKLLDYLLIICVLVAILNASIILVEFLSPEVKSIFEGFLVQSQWSNIDYAEHTFRFRGLAAGGGATLSIFNAMMITVAIYLFVSGKITSVIALPGSLIIALSNVFTGRTGLILGIILTFILIIIMFVKWFKSGLNEFVRNVLMVILGIVLFYNYVDIEIDTEVANWAFEWTGQLESGKVKTESSDELSSMIFLPDDFVHFMFGIGFYEGYGRLYPRSDSGYIKSILSIGVPLSICIYFIIISSFYQLTKVSAKYFWLVTIVVGIMLLLEFKEPVFYQNFLARFILVISGSAMYLLQKRSDLQKECG